MANGDLALFKALSVGRPWVLGIQNQVISYCGVGLCDPLLQNSVSAMEPFRYATVLFVWSLVESVIAGGPPPIVQGDNLDGDDLEIPTNQQRLAFTAGVGELIPGGWWIQTISDTDLFREGAPVCRGFMFLATGLTFNALDVFQRSGTGSSPEDCKLYSNWLQESEDGPGYGFLIQKFHINYTSIQFSFGDQGCSYRLAVGGFWPTWGDPAGAQTVRNGLVATPGMYLPFTTAVCIGSQDDCNELTITLSSGQCGRIQANQANPSIAGSTPQTTGTINDANIGDVYAPVRIVVVGYIVCVPFADFCGVPMLTPDEVILFRQRLGLVLPGGVPGTPGGALGAMPSGQYQGVAVGAMPGMAVGPTGIPTPG